MLPSIRKILRFYHHRVRIVFDRLLYQKLQNRLNFLTRLSLEYHEVPVVDTIDFPGSLKIKLLYYLSAKNILCDFWVTLQIKFSTRFSRSQSFTHRIVYCHAAY